MFSVYATRRCPCEVCAGEAIEEAQCGYEGPSLRDAVRAFQDAMQYGDAHHNIEGSSFPPCAGDWISGTATCYGVRGACGDIAALGVSLHAGRSVTASSVKRILRLLA